MKLTRNFLCLAAGLMAPFILQAQSVSQQPLTTMSEPPPNIIVTLDNSGSMGWDSNTDNTDGGCNNVPGGAAITGPNATMIRCRAANWNTLFYDHKITYLPWIKPDGTRCSAANPAAVLNEGRFGCGTGYNAGAPTTVNLTTAVLTDSPSRAYPDYWRLGPSFTDRTVTGNFIWIDLRTAAPTATFERVATRTDCSGPVGLTGCTRAEELQNFANWYQYYRTRMLMARGAMGEVFAEVNPEWRVGYALLSTVTTNINKVSYNRLRQGVGAFTDAHKNAWFQGIYNATAGGGTPLISVTRQVGDYFMRTDNGGPWGFNPPANAAGTQYTCRRNFHILMTDGVWDGDLRFNAPPAALGGAGQDIDGTAFTLPNGTPYTPGPPFRDCNLGVCVTNTGFLADAAFFYWSRDLRSDMANGLAPTATNTATWQHLVTYTVGFGLTGAITPANIGEIYAGTRNWGANAIDDLWHAAINGRGQYYSAQNPTVFAESFRAALADIGNQSARTAGTGASRTETSGLLTTMYASSFVSNIWSGDIQANAINRTTTPATVTEVWRASRKMPLPASRKLFSYSGSAGINYTWANLSSSQKASFANDEAAFDYTRGVSAFEQQYRPFPQDLTNPANLPFKFRNREIITAGINPVNVVGAIISSRPIRHAAGSPVPDTVYVASSAGMVHGFRASDGVELFAYIPSMVLPALYNSTKPDFNANFNRVLDGTVTTKKIESNSYLVGTLGVAGRGIFALDISNPSTFSVTNVLWEKSVASGTDFQNNLGVIMSEPRISWVMDGVNKRNVVLLPNGYASDNKKAGLFIIDLDTGSLLKYLDTGVGSAAVPNGLGGVSIRTKNNGELQYVYAGDLHGNVWKFDFTGGSAAAWKNALSGNAPLFTTSPAQPITAPIAIGDPFNEQTGGVMLYFGTGKLLETADQSNTDKQTFYAIWDNDTDAVQFSKLVQQTLTSGPLGMTTSNNTVDYATQRGWFIRFLDNGERVLVGALPRNNTVLFESMRPPTDFCQSGTNTNRLYGVSLKNAGTTKLFDVNNDGALDTSASMNISAPGIVADGARNPYEWGGKGKTVSKLCGDGVSAFSCDDGGGVLRRAVWRELTR